MTPSDPLREPHEHDPVEPELSPVWSSMRSALKERMRREQFETWFHRTTLSKLESKPDEGRVIAHVAVHNGFTRDWLTNYYADVLTEVATQVIGQTTEIVFDVDPELATQGLDDSEAGEASAEAKPRSSEAELREVTLQPAARRHPADDLGPKQLLPSSDVGLNPNYRFDSFVVGPCNRFAHAACVGVSENPGQIYNPLFLHGRVGLGKTHLIQSLCYTLLERNPSTKILFLSCETFVNHFIGALEHGDLERFRTKYRNVDVLVVDDIHLLANKERTQEEFFHTFNTLFNAGKQIVLSSDSPPVEIPSLQDRLVSRFKWGLVTEMETPCYETRMAILKRKSKERGHELPDDVASLLAERIDSNIRELEGAVTKILGYASLSGQPISLSLVRQCLRELFLVRTGQPSIEDIIKVVTDHFGVKLSELQSKKRSKAIAFPRQVAMYLARRITRLSLEEIGGYFGGRDHSTVLYGVRKITKLAKTDPEIQELMTRLLIELQGNSEF